MGTLEDHSLAFGASPVSVDVALAFRGPDDDAVTYAASLSAEDVAAVALRAAVVTVTPVGAGTAVVTVIASDGEEENAPATQSFTVTVVVDYDADADGLIEVRTLNSGMDRGIQLLREGTPVFDPDHLPEVAAGTPILADESKAILRVPDELSRQIHPQADFSVVVRGDSMSSVGYRTGETRQRRGRTSDGRDPGAASGRESAPRETLTAVVYARSHILIQRAPPFKLYD